jgi:hypothetical protein
LLFPPEVNRAPEGYLRAKRSTGTLGTSSVINPDLGGAHTSVLPDLFTGSLTATVSVAVPPSRSGLTPSIDLLYRSSNGNGWLGKGWDIEQGAIERNFRAGLSYEGSDYIFKSAAGDADIVNDGSGWYRTFVTPGIKTNPRRT